MVTHQDICVNCRNLPEEVPEHRFNDIPSHKDPDVFVANALVGDWGAESVDEAHSADNEARSSKTLGTHICVESFGGDDTLERSVCEAENDLEEEVSCQGPFGKGRAPDPAVFVYV